ncbi:MAG: hypothetical protein QXV01_08130 [Candidatus Bathyarchaeia archaeon]
MRIPSTAAIFSITAFITDNCLYASLLFFKVEEGTKSVCPTGCDAFTVERHPPIKLAVHGT